MHIVLTPTVSQLPKDLPQNTNQACQLVARGFDNMLCIRSYANSMYFGLNVVFPLDHMAPAELLNKALFGNQASFKKPHHY